MNIVDSSGWLEYFSGGPNAEYFVPPLENPSALIVPTMPLQASPPRLDPEPYEPV